MLAEKEHKKKEEPKYNMWQNTAYMLKKAWQVRKSVIWLCVLSALLAVGCSLTELFITPMILQKVEATVPLSTLLLTIIGFAGLSLVLSAVKTYVDSNTMFGRVEVRLQIIQDIHNKIAMTSFPNTEDTNVRQKLMKSYYSVGGRYRAAEGIWNTLADLLRDILGFGFYLLVLSSLDVFLIVVVVLTAVVGYFVNKHIYEWGYRHREEAEGYINQITYVAGKAENYKTAKDIRIFGMRSWLEDIYNSAMNLYQAYLARREGIYMIASVVDVVLSVLRNGIAYVYLISMALNEGLQASEFLLYFTAVSGFTAWITGILSGFSNLHRQGLDISVIREFLEIPEPFLFEEGEGLQVDLHKEYEIQLQNVSFRYPGAEQDTLTNINLTIHPGEKLAIVGLNGAGKTTLVKLLIGFYDPTEGEVLLNGVDIRKYNRRDFYKLFSAVFQQFSLLEVSVAENISQSADALDLESIKDCARKAGLLEKIESLPQQFETYLGREVYEDGIELSGGETQRLMLARALYKNAPIIVLDEPTAALDPIAENDIYLKYNEMTRGRTSVYISHRLASTRFCDRILFLEDGGISEEGTHESLLNLGGRYAELFEVQSRYYREGGASHEAE